MIIDIKIIKQPSRMSLDKFPEFADKKTICFLERHLTSDLFLKDLSILQPKDFRICLKGYIHLILKLYTLHSRAKIAIKNNQNFLDNLYNPKEIIYNSYIFLKYIEAKYNHLPDNITKLVYNIVEKDDLLYEYIENLYFLYGRCKVIRYLEDYKGPPNYIILAKKFIFKYSGITKLVQSPFISLLKDGIFSGMKYDLVYYIMDEKIDEIEDNMIIRKNKNITTLFFKLSCTLIVYDYLTKKYEVCQIDKNENKDTIIKNNE